jgi:hypothetical protein
MVKEKEYIRASRVDSFFCSTISTQATQPTPTQQQNLSIRLNSTKLWINF